MARNKHRILPLDFTREGSIESGHEENLVWTKKNLKSAAIVSMISSLFRGSYAHCRDETVGRDLRHSPEHGDVHKVAQTGKPSA
jgi:hypothetical protein